MPEVNLQELFDQYYPKAKDCIDGHIGGTKKTWFLEDEYDHDRYYIMVVERCTHCNVAMAEDFATKEQEKLYYAGQQP